MTVQDEKTLGGYAMKLDSGKPLSPAEKKEYKRLSEMWDRERKDVSEFPYFT